MNIPTLALKTSPLYLAAVLILLILFLILRNPVKSLIKSIKSKLKKRKLKRQRAKNRKLKQHQNIKIIEKVIHKKSYIQDWMTSILTILGAGLLLEALIKDWSFAVTSYKFLYESLFEIFRHHNLTTIIIAIVLSIAIYVIADILSFLKTKQSPILKTLHILIFSFLTSGILIMMIKALAYSTPSHINSIIMATMFIILAFMINYKRIFKKQESEETDVDKEDTISKIKEGNTSDY